REVCTRAGGTSWCSPDEGDQGPPRGASISRSLRPAAILRREVSPFFLNFAISPARICALSAALACWAATLALAPALATRGRLPRSPPSFVPRAFARARAAALVRAEMAAASCSAMTAGMWWRQRPSLLLVLLRLLRPNTGLLRFANSLLRRFPRCQLQ